MRPPARRLVNGTGSLFRRGEVGCHCLLVDAGDGSLTLIDTGLGTADITRPRQQLGTEMALFLHPEGNVEFTAPRQVEALGYSPNDVTDVYLTHLDVDHRGALADFPNATIHVSQIELDTVRHPPTWKDRRRYRGDWHRELTFTPHTPTGAQWFEMPVLHELPTAPIVMVHLPGHTAGHSGVAVQTAHEQWVLHAGDAVQHVGELSAARPVPRGIQLFTAAAQADRSSRLRTRDQLRALASDPRFDIIAAHDPTQLSAITRDRKPPIGCAPPAPTQVPQTRTP